MAATMAAPMMMTAVKLRWCSLRFCRCIHVSRLASTNASSSKYMKKIVDKGSKKKDKWFANAQILPSNTTGKKTKRQYSDRLKKRQNNLNVYLYHGISEIMSTGELGVNVPILQVELVPDYSAMKIYWEASGNEAEDNKMQEQLNKAASRLRQELVQLKVMGCVPPIDFIRDLSTHKHQQLDELFATLDTGPPELEDAGEDEHDDDNNDGDDDDEDIQTNERMGFLQMMKESEAKQNISTLTAEVAEEILRHEQLDKTRSKKQQRSTSLTEDTESKTDKSYRQDLYGLHHDVLMNKVLAAKNTSDRFRPVNVSDGSEKSIVQKLILEGSRFERKVNKPVDMRKIKARATKQLQQETLIEMGYGHGRVDYQTKSVDNYRVVEDEKYFVEDIIDSYMDRNDQDTRFELDRDNDMEYKK